MSQVNLINSKIYEAYNLNLSADQTAKTQSVQIDTQTPEIVKEKINSTIPKLTGSTMSASDMAAGLAAVPSFGASLLSLITQMSAEQRQANRDQKVLQTEAQIEKIKEQADTMRQKAITQLVLGVVTGSLSIAQGFSGMSLITAGKSDAYVTSFNNIMKGFSDSVSGVNQSAGGFFDANIKDLQAQEERIKAMTDQLDSLDHALKELIQKALDTQNAIQENMNQTRTKILG